MLPARYQRILGWFVVLAGGFFVAFGAITFLHGRALESRGVVVDAEVTRATRRESDSDTGHQLRYRFRVGDRDYERVGIFGTPVGADVTASDQAEAVASGRIAVRYLAEDPSVNEPLAHARPQGQRGLIAMFIGALMVVGGAVRLALARRQSRAAVETP